MADDNDDLDVETDDEVKDDANGPKALRAHLKKLETELKNATAELGTLRKEKRQVSLADLLEKAGAPKRLARYANADITEPTAESVSEWLKENGEDFGWQPPTEEETDTAAQQQAISKASAAAEPSHAGSSADLLAKLKTGDYKTLVEQGLLPASSR